MPLLDVNVLIYAHRWDLPQHAEYRQWLEEAATGDTPLGLADVVLSGFLRIVTNPRAFDPPTSMVEAFAFCNVLRSSPAAVAVNPGAGHWEIFARLCALPGIQGHLVPDAYLAALAIETGSEFVTTDGDFARFPGLRWRHPLRP